MNANRVIFLFSLVICMSLFFLQTASAFVEGDELSSQARRDSVRKAKKLARENNKGQTFVFYYDKLQVGIPVFDTIKISMHGFQKYDKTTSTDDFRNSRGNFAMPDQLLNIESDEESGYKLRLNTYSAWQYTVENTPFYQTKNPYSALFYANSFGKNLNYFTAQHSQNFARGFNLAIDFNVLDNIGQYQNSRSKLMNFRVYGNYFSKDGRYKLLFGYIRNTEKIGENGGIINDSLFINHITNKRSEIPVNLSNAIARWRENTYFFKQTYHFYDNKNDSIIENDKSYGFISHSFEFNDNEYSYIDKLKDGSPGSNFYDNYYLNKLGSSDTTNNLRMVNRVFYANKDMERISYSYDFKFALGVKNEMIKYRDAVSSNLFTQWFPFVRVQMDFIDRFIFGAYLDYGFGGYNKNDFNLNANVKYLFNGETESVKNRDGIETVLGVSKSQAYAVSNYYMSNHFYWVNNFAAEKELFAKLKIKYKGWWLDANFAYKDDYVFFKKQGPVQADKSFFTLNARFGKNVVLWKYFGWDNTFMFAYSSNQDFLHLPLFSLKESLYAIIPIKNIAKIHIGVDLYYNTPYYGDAYMPDIATYYWQDDVKTGNSLVMDVFINFEIKKRATIFLKGQNIAQGMIAYDYIYTPHYPTLDRSFRVGLIWRFYD